MTTSRERERVLEEWLKQSGGARSAPTADCLDAETAAAWADGRLRGTALAEAQLHAADCSRCQALMATLLKTTPEQVAAALAPSPRRWLAWAMPIAAAATIVIAGVLWVNTPRPQSTSEQVDVGPLPPPPADRPLPREPRRQAAAPRSGANGTQSPAPAGVEARSAQAAKAGESAASRVAKSAETVAVPTTPRQVAPAPPAPVTPPPAAPSVAPSIRSQAPDAAPSVSRDSVSDRADARREAGTAAAAPLMRPAPPSDAPVHIVSPNAAIRWRVNGAIVERTSDGGSTWTGVATLPGVITSGSAPSASVCWLAGRGGLVFRTTDGTNWSRVTFPETVDLVAVGAVNAQTATVTAADGRVFVTANGGQYWVADR